MKKNLLLIISPLLSLSFLVGCNDTIDNPETNRTEMEEENVNEADEMKMDDEMDELDLVDEDSYNDGRLKENGEHPFDLNEDGELNINQ